MNNAGVSLSIYFDAIEENVWATPPTLAMASFYVTYVLRAFCSRYGLKTWMIRIFWKAVSFSHAAGSFFSGSSLLFHSSNSRSLKLTCLAILGKFEQKLLKASCLSKVDQDGKITLFSKGGGIRPAKNSHSWVDIYCGKTPFTKNNPNANRSFLNNALDTFPNTILLTYWLATSSLAFTEFFSIESFEFVLRQLRNNLLKYFRENRYMLLIFHSCVKIKYSTAPFLASGL